MSSIPYPPDFDRNLEEERSERRDALAVTQIDPGDVIAEVESLVAQIIDPERHPLYPMVCWLLDRRLTPGDGAHFWDTWKRLACQAINRLVDEALARGED
jgi:hypothetical protein